MAEQRRERADAARNRQAILRAAEELLAAHRPEDISLEQVAAAAGVGKGTVFHRFGNRTGLMYALMEQRAQALERAIATGPPPLGPGAPPADRLSAFLDAVVDLVTRNVGLIAAVDHAATTQRHGDGAGQQHPMYVLWHGHLAALLAEENPDADADLVAHLVLGSMHSEPVLGMLRRGESHRIAAGLRVLAAGALHAS
ncbi:MAG: TetR/AcrR family transcriptional regulator [Mycobacteriales bacterium]